MKLIGEQVQHRQFGGGIITEQTTTTISVQFAGECGIKKFLCPSAFESFLMLSDACAKQAMADELRQIRDLAEADRRAGAKERQKKRAEDNPAASGRKPASGTKRAAKKAPAGKPKYSAPEPENENAWAKEPSEPEEY